MGSSGSSERRRQQQQQQQAARAAAPPVVVGPAGSGPGVAPRSVAPQPTAPPGATPGSGAPGMPAHLLQFQQPGYQQSYMQRPPMAPHAAGPPPGAMGGGGPAPAAAVKEARTIHNQCTILRDSVKFDAATLTLTFQTHTLVPCSYIVHTAVRVDIKHGAFNIAPNRQKDRPEEIFIPEPQEGAAHSALVDFRDVTDIEKTFDKKYPKQFPCIVALKYEISEGARVFDVTEYTCIGLLPTCTVIKQVLEYDGACYLMEHLFGGEHTTAVASGEVTTEVEMDEDDTCVVCLTNKKNTAAMPCRHMCVCKECADELRRQTPTKCPMCRNLVSQFVAIGGTS